MHLKDAIALSRPRQWTKNIAVFAGIVFAGRLTDGFAFLHVCVALAGLVLVTSGVYCINDATDADRDRLHPAKRERPVASGRVSRAQAYGLGIVLEVAGLALAWSLGLPFLACVVAYVVLQVAYTFGLKNVMIVDLLVISAGFVLRAIAGAVVISVPVSPWLVGCTGLLALFLAAAKRRHEIVLLHGQGDLTRPVLSEYTAELLDSYMVTLSAATITSYALYTFYQSVGRDFVMMLTIPFVIYGVLRYQYLVLRCEGGGSPEDVLLGDKPILLDIVLWTSSVVLALYVVPRFVR